MEPEPPRSRWWIPVLVTLLILGILAAVLFVLARNLLQDEGDDLVAVPDVTGMRFAAARAILEDRGFVVVDPPLSEPAEDHPDEVPGTVVAQDPQADEEVAEGTEVTLTIVARPEQVEIPDLEGESPEDAAAALEELGLVPVGPVSQASDTIEEGLVIGTQPPAGTSVDPESEVTIIVSSGSGQVEVPDVRCLPVDAALNQLDNEGLEGFVSEERRPTSCPTPDMVAEQTPLPGSFLDPGDTVTLFLGEESEPTGPTGPTGATGETGDNDRR
jgi:serine/threonine-protein kinase